MRSKIAVIVATLAVSAAAVADAGKGHYVTCVACHGANAEGNPTMNAPRLNHLEPVYIAAQLDKFRSGVRGAAGDSTTAMQMAPMAATLADNQAVQDVASYIAGLEGGPAEVSVEGDVVLGGDYFNQFCGACHGARAQGNTALNSPRLAGSDDWYLVAQLEAFRSGTRGTHADDRTGKQMRAMAGVLPNDQAIRDVVAFIRSLPQ